MFNFGCICRLKKPFDTADHEILLQKLMHVGITGNVLLLLKSYLTNHTQNAKSMDPYHVKVV